MPERETETKAQGQPDPHGSFQGVQGPDDQTQNLREAAKDVNKLGDRRSPRIEPPVQGGHTPRT